jgi:hypothetical protein
MDYKHNNPKGLAMTTDIESLFDSFLLEDDEEEFDGTDSLDVHSFPVRGQFILDGATTLQEAADMARAFADYLDMLEDQGYQLVDTIQDDKGFAAIVD